MICGEMAPALLNPWLEVTKAVDADILF